MHKYIRFILIVPLILSIVVVAQVMAFQGEGEDDGCVGEEECYEEDNGGGSGGGEGESNDEDDDDSGDEGGSNEPDPSDDGRLNYENADYYTIYCHAGTDTIYVVRVVPVVETIKEISLAAAISLGVGAEMGLGDNMTMARTSEDIITIYGSNGNLAPEPGSKSFSLSACIEANGGAPNMEPSDDDNGGSSGGGGSSGDGEDEETEQEAFARRSREAQEALAFCYESYSFFGGDSDILVDCLNFTLRDYQDVLPGDDVLTLIVMIFCLNLIVGNGVLPIGIIISLGAYRRWLRHWKPPTQSM
jgi:hypothetical protein